MRRPLEARAGATSSTSGLSQHNLMLTGALSPTGLVAPPAPSTLASALLKPNAWRIKLDLQRGVQSSSIKQGQFVRVKAA